MSLDQSDSDSDEPGEFTQARFPIDLHLPPADTNLLENARRAIRREYRDSAKWKRLKCRDVSVISETETGTVFVLQIGHAVEFDWTWEGAVAFRPLMLREFEDSQATFFENGANDPEIDDSIVWSGEVLEVDEATGRIFIVVTNPEYPPRRGSFYVRPFEFLAFLDAVYNEPEFTDVRERLPSRLAAAIGGIHPDISNASNVGVNELTSWWRKSWSVLWGPPGTGKTYMTGQQAAKVLADPSERILVVSTTNRATDAAAISIGRAARNADVGLSQGKLLRIGKGASLKKFEEERLTDMLRGTETEFLAQIETLAKLLSDPKMRSANGMFISPFKAQAKSIHSFFAANNLHSWMASTVHSQQGSEADIVIFDSVNAGSYGWPYGEWKRLVNVALSRSREAIIVLSSRAEMDEPYLRPLLKHLSPRVLRKRGSGLSWEDVDAKTDFKLPNVREDHSPYLLGNQLAKRKELRPVLSHEQERLCGLELDGKPRLVRGVAGSGKTIVLAHWLMQTLQRLEDQPNVRIWAVFANRSLQSLIGDSIQSAWDKESDGKSFPLDRVELHHINEILEVMLPEVGLSLRSFGFEYDEAAEAYLDRKQVQEITARCDAVFIDEAQDMGPNTLKLLSAIVKNTSDDDENSRSINIFYDNAQNIYGRSTPKWSDLGLDMRGRSTVMKESFRSTKPITEFALNVLYRLQPPDTNPDHKELVTRGLIERTKRNGSDWWNVRFNQVDGPKPQFRQYPDLESEFEAIGEYCRELIEEQGVQPSDICLIYNGKNIKYRLETIVRPMLTGLGVELSIQTNKPFSRSNNVLLGTTSHSFKGYDSEIVIVPAADQYIATEKGILANNLYVAMTRARSILTLFAQKKRNANAQLLYGVLNECLDNLEERPEVETDMSPQDDFVAILDQIGHEHRKWFVGVWNQFKLNQEPLMTKSSEIVAEPLFSFRADNITYACFGSQSPRQRVRQRLDDFGIKLLELGQSIDNVGNDS